MDAIRKLKLICWTILLSSLVSACGWHLRGQVVLPAELATLTLECGEPASNHFCSELESQLRANGVTISDQAPYGLDITSSEFSRRAISITSDATASDYELIKQVGFSLTGADGAPIIKDNRVSSSQTYSYDRTAVLGKSQEEEQLLRQMDPLLARQIISRLAPYTLTRIESIRDEYQARQSDAQ